MKANTLKTVADLLPARNPEQAKDIQLLHELMPSLSDEGILALYFRFWERLLIEDIASILGRSWDYTDHLIEQSIKDLRGKFVKNQQSGQFLQAA